MAGKLNIRFAEPGEEAQILRFIKKLAEYTHMLDQVTTTEEILREWVFEKKKAEVLFGEIDGKIIGFALFYHSFSTFTGKAPIFLEDFYVLEEERGKGYGREILLRLAQIAIERGCGRLEWGCLNWNKPSIEFYLSLGADTLDDWTQYRLSGEKLINFAEGKRNE